MGYGKEDFSRTLAFPVDFGLARNRYQSRKMVAIWREILLLRISPVYVFDLWATGLMAIVGARLRID